jgi:hypothetical protein
MGKIGTLEQIYARKQAKKSKEAIRLAQTILDSTHKHCTELLEAGVIPDATRHYKIGDRVRYGAWDWSAVLAVYENGKYYKLVTQTRHIGRNIPDSSELRIHYLPWFNFVSYQSPEEIFEIDSLIEGDDIFFSYSQRDLSSLINMYFNKHGIDFEPEYQRGNVWSLEKKVELIDSIFKNVDIGKFAVISRPWGPDGNKPLTPKLWEMLDGKQRLTAIIDFFTNQFSYKGKYYDDLSPHDRYHFKHYSAAIAETENLTKAQKYRYFLKLNTTGTPQDPEHMKKVTDMLAKEMKK